MKNKIKVLLIVLCAMIALTAVGFALVMSSGNFRDTETPRDSIEMNMESPFGYVPVIPTSKNVQMGKNYVYFAGTDKGIFKYDITTGTVSNYCTDPLCKHYGADSTCRIANYLSGNFFRASSNLLLYNAVLQNEELGRVTPHLYCFDSVRMQNTLLDDNASTSNYYSVSNRYAYFTNVTVQNGKTCFNFKQVDLSTGEIKIFGEAKEDAPEYTLIGAVGGKLFAADAESTATYVCSEDDPGNFTPFWDKVISYIYAGENNLFFKSRDPEDDTPKDKAKYYYYHTDYDGNVISKHELTGGMKWGSIFDGRNLYYIPSDEIEITLPDGKTKKTHPREVYKLDIKTGEQTVAFKFDGDYYGLSIGFGSNDLIVYDNKIYTSDITGNIYSENEAGEITAQKLVLNKGLVIIDMLSGNIEYVTANYDRTESDGFELLSNTKKIEMNKDRK